jgi:U3 small nucleolar RNA-associated protein 10
MADQLYEQLGSYVLLSTLSQVCTFTAEALRAVLNAMAASARFVSVKQFLRAAVSICAAQQQVDVWFEGTLSSLLALE